VRITSTTDLSQECHQESKLAGAPCKRELFPNSDQKERAANKATAVIATSTLG
jgi:hypothetical protein